MFVSLAKLAGKAFVVGYLLPTLMASISILYLFNDVDRLRTAYDAVLGVKSFGDVTVAVLMVWAAATLLMVGNIWQYRILEGYIGPFAKRAWKEAHQTEQRNKRQALNDSHVVLTDPTAGD